MLLWEIKYVYGVVSILSLIDLVVIAVALSMDAFAVSVCTGLTLKRATFMKMLTVGIYFGVFQAVMPLIGYLTANIFAEHIIEFDHWIAFGLLSFLGARMIYSCIKSMERSKGKTSAEAKGVAVCTACETIDHAEVCTVSGRELTPKEMLPLAIATSIDALAVGVSFAFLKVNIIPAVALIGAITLVLSMLGVKIGNVFGARFKTKAELAGGIILILIGIRILLEHLDILNL